MEDWQITTVGETCKILNGYAFKSKDYVSRGGILNFRVTNIDWNGTVHIEDNVEYLPGNFEKTYKKHLLAHDDVIFVMVGATRGKLSQIPQHILPALMNQNMWRIVPVVEGLDKRYLYFYLRSKIDDLLRANEDQARGFFKKSDFKAISISLPPLPEQRKIAGVLGMVQRAMEQQERLLALTAELKKALLHKLFTEGLRGETQKQTEIGRVPECWGVATLESVAVAFDYGTSVKCEHGKAGVPVLRIPNVVGGSIDLSDLKHGQPKRSELEQLRLQDGDLLFVRTNGVLQNAGRCALYRGELEDSYFASYLIRVRVDSSKVLPAFVNEYARTERGRSFLSGRAIRTADGKFNINSGTLKQVLLPLPSIEEQKEVVRQLDLVERKLKLHGRKHATLTALFRTLLHQLMTAHLRVHDLDLDKLECILERGDVSPLSEGATRRADQSADSSAHSEKQNGDTSPHVTIRKVK